MALDIDLVRASLKAGPGDIAWSISHVVECTSTQDLAQMAIASGQGHGFVVTADYQQAGRGRQGASWVAPPESALLLSLLLEPDPSTLPLCSLLAGVAVASGIAAASGLETAVKWPNDVMVCTRKLAGILVQHPPGRIVIIGIGVNVNAEASAFPPGLQATSLLIELGRRVAREPLLAAILDALAAGLVEAARAGPRVIVEAFRRHSSMLGRPIAFQVDGAEQVGVAEDLMEDGALLVRLTDGSRRRLYAGSVRQVLVS